MDGASPPPPSPPPQSLSLIASLLTAAALAPTASAVVGASPAAIEALNGAAAAALVAVRGAVQDITLPVPAAASGPPAVSAPAAAAIAAPAAAAIAAPAVPAVAAPAAPSAQRRDRGKLMLGEKLLVITQVADRVPRETLALRYGVTKRAIYGVWAGRSKTWDAAARGVPLRAHCVQVCRFPLIDKLLYEWFMRIRSMGRKTMPISRIALQVKASQLARLHYPAASFSESNGFVDRWVKRHSIRSVHLHGSGGGIDLVEGKRRMDELREKMVGLDPECILSMDEAALFYLPTPTC